MTRPFVLLSALLVACGGSGGGASGTLPTAPPPDLGPVKIALTAPSLATSGTTDMVTVTVTNSGGAGTYYLEFWGYPILPTCVSGLGAGPCPNSGMQSLGDAQSVQVTAGYSQTLTYSVPSALVASVKAFVQPLNSATFSETDCAKVRAYGVCP